MSEDTPQLDEIQAAIRELAGAQEHLNQLADKIDMVLGRWTRLEEHHARALADLQHSAARVQLLERRLQQYIEKAPHDGFIRPPGEAGDVPGTMKTVVDAFERVEARLAAREAEVGRWMLEAQSDLQSATMLLKGKTSFAPDVKDTDPGHPPAAIDAQPEPEEESHSPGPMFRPDPSATGERRRQPGGTPDLSNINGVDRIESVDNADGAADANRRVSWAWLAVPALIAGAIAVAYSLQLRGRTLEADTRARSAEQQLSAAQVQAKHQLEDVRAASEREVMRARESAAKANAIADVLASPDLIRFDLTGTPLAPRARGQGLWSRSRGLVFTASRLPTLPEGSVYQLWLVTNAGPVNVGTVTPDSAGRVTFVADELPNIAARVIGVMLTAETQGEHQAPEGAAYLVRSS